MKIFITNDDGYQADGFKILAGICRRISDSVWGIAPKGKQSGTSMAVNLADPQIAYKDLGGSMAYLDAAPASCVKYMMTYTPHRDWPDLLVSGINHGSNASTGACYSGTLGAAEEGALNGIRSIGVSVDDEGPHPDFSGVEKYFPLIVKALLSDFPDGKGIFYNVNFPAIPADRIKGIRVSRMGMGHWEKEFRDLGLPLSSDGECFHRMTGFFVDDTPASDLRADHHLISEGYIAITPMLVDNTAYSEIERLKALFPDTAESDS